MTFEVSSETKTPHKSDSQSGVINSKEKDKGKKVSDNEDTECKMIPILLSSGKASSISVDEMERTFNTDLRKGLSEEEAERRRKVYGSNDFDVGEELPLWKKYCNQVRWHNIG